MLVPEKRVGVKLINNRLEGDAKGAIVTKLTYWRPASYKLFIQWQT